MRNLLIESYRIYKKPLNWWIGRLDNWRFAGYTQKIREELTYYQKNAHLWRKDNKDLVGFFISENGKEYFELQIHPSYRFLEDEMLQWTIEHWARGKKQIVTNIYACDRSRIRLLEKYKFVRHELVGVDYRYDTKNYTKDIDMNKSFHIETFSENYDYEAKIETQRVAFSRDKSQLNREWLETKIMAPGYSSDWDFAVVSSEGKQVAFCVAWLDRENKIAEIDPVGTHPDYRKRGFAKAVITNCFIRLKQSGIEKVQIQGFSEAGKNLYNSLKPAETYELLEYKLGF